MANSVSGYTYNPVKPQEYEATVSGESKYAHIGKFLLKGAVVISVFALEIIFAGGIMGTVVFFSSLGAPLALFIFMILLLFMVIVFELAIALMESI
ncbi:MAG: hypothetical protein WDZ28_02475 [Simkaniaceae bacterium]